MAEQNQDAGEIVHRLADITQSFLDGTTTAGPALPNLLHSAAEEVQQLTADLRRQRDELPAELAQREADLQCGEEQLARRIEQFTNDMGSAEHDRQRHEVAARQLAEDKEKLLAEWKEVHRVRTEAQEALASRLLAAFEAQGKRSDDALRAVRDQVADLTLAHGRSPRSLETAEAAPGARLPTLETQGNESAETLRAESDQAGDRLQARNDELERQLASERAEAARAQEQLRARIRDLESQAALRDRRRTRAINPEESSWHGEVDNIWVSLIGLRPVVVDDSISRRHAGLEMCRVVHGDATSWLRYSPNDPMWYCLARVRQGPKVSVLIDGECPFHGAARCLQVQRVQQNTMRCRLRNAPDEAVVRVEPLSREAEYARLRRIAGR